MTKYIPWLFECWECEKTHEMVDGNYVVEKNDPPRGPKDTKFFCIPCAEKVWGREPVERVLASGRGPLRIPQSVGEARTVVGPAA